MLVLKQKTKTTQHFLQKQENQLNDMQEHFESYSNTLPVFGYNSVKYDLKLIKNYLLPILVNERDFEPFVFKNSTNLFRSHLVMFNFLTFLTCLEVLPILIHSWKLTRHRRPKWFFPYEWFNHSVKLNDEELPPYEAFHIKRQNFYPLEKEYQDYKNWFDSSLTTESKLVKMRISEKPITGAPN